jgi:hypothetical protein
MTQHNRYLRRGKPYGFQPGEFRPERVERTESDETRRRNRDWLRERSDEDAIDFPDEYSDAYREDSDVRS